MLEHAIPPPFCSTHALSRSCLPLPQDPVHTVQGAHGAQKEFAFTLPENLTKKEIKYGP